jgi:hypothetical protein
MLDRREFLERMLAAGLVVATPKIFPVKLWTPAPNTVTVSVSGLSVGDDVAMYLQSSAPIKELRRYTGGVDFAVPTNQSKQATMVVRRIGDNYHHFGSSPIVGQYAIAPPA